MGPLSARLLMQRGRPKSDRLGKIRSLDLSGMKLLSEHLDPKLLSRLKQLQELDLSNNQLETLPANLGLSHLRVLRCANNQLGDVTALCQFPQLEELSLEGNPFLTVRMISEELVASGGIQVREADVPERPPKATAAREPRAKPVALKRPDDTPLSLSPNKRVCTSSSSAHVEGSDGSQPTLEPLHFLQCHSKNNSPRDLETQLWACAFEPAWEEGQAGATSQTVATCGGEAVCVIDCQTGIVLHKYKAPGEEFFSVAWTALTVVTQAGHKKRWSVLAAAGLRGLVRLLHVRAGFCCGVIRAHKKAIATLCFSPTHETHLFTASYDKRIILWDLGVPNHDYEFQASQLLTLDTASIPLRLCPVASCPDTYLLAGCEGGCCCWDVRLDQPQKRRVCEVEFVFSEGAEAAGRRVDGLAFVNEDVVASKGNSLGTICLWSWSQTWMGRGKQSTLAVVVLARLQWSPTKLAYFSLSTCPDEGIVLCGDEEGNVWVYDVRHILTQPPPRPAAPQAPTQILKWPQPWALGQMVTKTMVNTVVANPTFTYLTALTDSNIVAIWKRQ
ncbi:leucine-rich repeat and WD repeat-containing protein 1 isoform X4 [Canis lupus baileyi]|uniref:leucine-rich repeat and WD repeat-containing protein 1 isoform X4 n=1 Tax=Canis lupus dingo TaxID=286419 RepID=UPI000DC6B212|nr:leucine-rich repeat and WD repeat-containing protein 1 isoform X4 [Canis lupus dingo]XP_038523888.1 leucine-rich repeat and WD repeat-containing protein 1 isoform X4 [Canis lupus familiaris]